MKRLVIVAGGTRGDVQPCIVLGKGLQAVGYDVTLVAGSDFADWIQSEGIGFVDMGVDIRAVMSDETGRNWVDSSPLMEIPNMRKTFMSVAHQVIDQLTAVLPSFDAIITGLTMMPITVPIARAKHIPLINLLFSPAYPTKLGAASMIALRPQAETGLNLLSRPMMLRAMWYTGSEGTKITCERMGIPALSYTDFVDAWLQTPTLIAISPCIVPQAADYPDHVQVTGYLFMDDEDWTPPAKLSVFLDSGEPPVYIGFGSMTGRNADSMPMLIEALAGRRGIINRGWGAIESQSIPDSIYLLDGAPHGWLFPRVGAVVHHGGAGTTGAALRAGVPSVIVPHMADQPYYARRVAELGVGAEPIPRKRLNAMSLRDAINQVMNSSEIRSNTQALSKVIRGEDGVINAVDFICRHIG